MEAEKKQRGGKREGAGRKKNENGRNIAVAFKLSAKAFNLIERMAAERNTTKNDIINIILEKMADESSI